MFGIFEDNELLTKVDIHSHILPHIDDGSKSMANSLEFIKKLKLLGYEKLVLTPHISDMFQNSTQTILREYLLLKKELKENRIDIELEIGAEYYVDDRFKSLLESRDILSFGCKNYILFEFSYFSAPMDIDNIINEIFRMGYIPILAHPERYLYWHDSFSSYKYLKDMGVLFQININSILGFYSRAVRDTVQKIILNGMVDFIGTDLHSRRHIKALEKSISLSLYKKIPKYNNILNDTLYSISREEMKISPICI